MLHICQLHFGDCRRDCVVVGEIFAKQRLLKSGPTNDLLGFEIPQEQVRVDSDPGARQLREYSKIAVGLHA